MPRLPIPTLVFFLMIFGLPIVQAGLELARGDRVQALEVLGPIEEARLRTFEDDLHDASVLQARFIPAYQLMLTRYFGRGNERALVGRDGWLYYEQDVAHVTGPAVLGPGGAGEVAIATLARFRDELAAAGVELLLVPVPTKSSIEPRFLSIGAAAPTADNPDTHAFLERLDAAGLEVLDLYALFAELRAGGESLYMTRDTHWTPATMQTVARAVADRAAALASLPSPATRTFTGRETTVPGQGDIVGMLNLPDDVEFFEPLNLELEQVFDDGEPWAPDPEAEVLLLGDSFTRVFSDPELEMGTGAGLAEHLSLALQRPVDVIAMSGGGAAGVRTALARRPGGPEATGGLGGKRIVVWEFTLRELSADRHSWRWIDLPEIGPAAQPSEPEEPEPATAGRFEVTAELVEVSVLDPDFDYAFCLGIFEYRVIEGEHEGPLWVAFPVMIEHDLTDAAAFATGTKHRLTLEPIEDHYNLETTSWVDDTDAGWDIFMVLEWGAAE